MRIVGLYYDQDTDPDFGIKSVDTIQDEVVAKLGQLGNPYQFNIFDIYRDYSLDLGVTGAPETFMIDKQGVVRLHHIGDVNPRVWSKQICAALSGITCPMRLIILGLLCLCTTAFAAEENYHFDDPAKQALFRDLTEELRCPQCQNQNIADSDAMIAFDLRRKVYQLLQQGYTREQVVDYMKVRYGDFVSYQPPVTPATLWLWLLPVLFVAAAVLLLIRHRVSAAASLDESQLAKAEKLLERDQ